ncbi:7857_t:CDS:2, partial [Scutellospora calospora]
SEVCRSAMHNLHRDQSLRAASRLRDHYQRPTDKPTAPPPNRKDVARLRREVELPVHPASAQHQRTSAPKRLDRARWNSRCDRGGREMGYASRVLVVVTPTWSARRPMLTSTSAHCHHHPEPHPVQDPHLVPQQAARHCRRQGQPGPRQRCRLQAP